MALERLGGCRNHRRVAEPREFISYTTPYDHHVGRWDWNELDPEQQDDLLWALVAGEHPYNDAVMASDLYKAQADGLAAALIHARLRVEEIEGDWFKQMSAERQRERVAIFLQGTTLGARLDEMRERRAAGDGAAGPVTPLNGPMLGLLAQSGIRPSILDQTIGMPWSEARAFFARFLAAPKAVTPPKAPQPAAPSRLPPMPKRLTPLQEIAPLLLCFGLWGFGMINVGRHDWADYFIYALSFFGAGALVYFYREVARR